MNQNANAVADKEGVEIRTYSVIYKIVEELRDAMEGLLVPEEVEDIVGSAEVRATFRPARVLSLKSGVKRNPKPRAVANSIACWCSSSLIAIRARNISGMNSAAPSIRPICWSSRTFTPPAKHPSRALPANLSRPPSAKLATRTSTMCARCKSPSNFF